MKQKEFVLLKHHHPILDMIKVDDREFCSSAFKVFFGNSYRTRKISVHKWIFFLLKNRRKVRHHNCKYNHGNRNESTGSCCFGLHS